MWKGLDVNSCDPICRACTFHPGPFLCPWAPERWPIILVNSKTLELDPLNLNNFRHHVT